MLLLKNKNITNLIICVTKRCNLKCNYCYIKQEERDINMNVLEKNLNFFMRCEGNAKEVIFTGGEPLLRTDIVRVAINEIETLKNKFPQKKITTVINTNGTITAENAFDIFGRVDYIVFSLDGQASTHNLHRKYHNGKKTFDRVMRNLRIIQRKYPQKIAINKVITSDSAHTLFEDTKFLINLHPAAINLMIALGDLHWDKEKASILFKDTRKVFSWLKKHRGNINIKEMFKWIFKPALNVCALARLWVEPGGDLYPCGILLSRKEGCIGNIALGWLRPDSINCKFSIKNDRCLNELCRSCNKICRKTQFNFDPAHSRLLTGNKWVEKAFHFGEVLKNLDGKN